MRTTHFYGDDCDPPHIDPHVEAACKVMHDAYEEAAVIAGWETNQASRLRWADVPEANKETMRAAVSALLDWLTQPHEVPAPGPDVGERATGGSVHSGLPGHALTSPDQPGSEGEG